MAMRLGVPIFRVCNAPRILLVTGGLNYIRDHHVSNWSRHRRIFRLDSLAYLSTCSTSLVAKSTCSFKPSYVVNEISFVEKDVVQDCVAGQPKGTRKLLFP